MFSVLDNCYFFAKQIEKYLNLAIDSFKWDISSQPICCSEIQHYSTTLKSIMAQNKEKGRNISISFDEWRSQSNTQILI